MHGLEPCIQGRRPRVWYRGRASAFQADDVGSFPTTRSNHSRHSLSENSGSSNRGIGFQVPSSGPQRFFWRKARLSEARRAAPPPFATMLTMLDGKERRDCESRGFCSTQNVSTNHADQTNYCDFFPSWPGLSRPSTRFSLHGARRLCRSGADSLGTGGVVGRRGWPGHRAFRRTPVLRRAMSGHDVAGCVFHAARLIRRDRPKAAPNSR
jgi:hypothetical protein